jgi:hypothetical protein
MYWTTCDKSARIEYGHWWDILEVVAIARDITNLGANAAFNYVVLRDRSIPLIVNCSGRYMAELLKTRVEQFYPGGLQSGAYIEKWSLPGGKYRERRTPAEEILSLSSTDNKLGISTNSLVLIIVAQLPHWVSVLTVFGTADHVRTIHSFI